MREPDWHTARRLAGQADALPGESVPLIDAEGRTLCEPVRARTDLPAFDTSAMDGWAVAGDGPWEIVGAVLAGQAPGPDLRAGQAVGIATGAAVPAGTSAIVRTEHGRLDGTLTGTARPEDIRPAGEECRAGDVLAESGSVVGPGLIGLFAAAGLDTVRVSAVPRVALVLFGDELVEQGVAGIGRVRDSLGPQLPGWIGRLGAQVVSLTRAQDTLAAHVQRIREATADADIVMTTGGTAAGPVDHLHTAIGELGGRFVVDSVAVRPGHPMALARLGKTSLLALPGNPQSAIVALLSLGQPLIESLLGRTPGALPEVVLAEAALAPPTEHRLLASRLRDGRAVPVRHLGSAMLRGLANSDGFALLPPGGAPAGEPVPWLALP